MVEINWTVFLQMANFLVLIFILNSVLYKPIRTILIQRKDKMNNLERSALATSEQAEGKNKAFTDGIKEARAQGQNKKEALMQSASEEESKIIAKITAKAQEDLAAAKAQIAKDTDAVRTALEKEVDAFANAITQKILGRAA